MGIFDFDDYRSWLTFVISEKVARNKRFSLNQFAGKAKMSQSLLSLILSGKRKLSKDRASGLAQYLGLGQAERKYLALLVEKGRSASLKQSNALRRELDELKKRAYTAKRSGGENQRPFSAWYYNLLLAATDLTGIEKTDLGLARHLGLPVEHVSSALRLMTSLGLIKRVNDTYHWVNGAIRDLPATVIRQSVWKVCKTILERAQIYFSTNHLDVDTIVGGIIATNPEQVKIANEKIARFSEEIQAMLGQGEKTLLVQFSALLFEVE